jgi:hypothetical protein
MTRSIWKISGAVAACVVAAIAGCGGHTAAHTDPLLAISSPAIPAAAQEIPNPLRGQYEDLLTPLFPQNNPAQRRYPAWPKTYDAGTRVSWRQLQPKDPGTLAPDAPDDQKYDFSVIDDTLAQLASRGVRFMLRVYAYNSCCDTYYPNDTNIAIPDWVRTLPGASTDYPGPPTGSSAPRITQVVPNWDNPNYLGAFEQLLAALGRRYDQDERFSVFEFSGYGDFGEDHIAYLRDALRAPGPAPEDSVAALGYYSQFRDQNITTASIRRLVAAHVNAFPHTQLVVNLPNPEIVRQLLANDVTKKLAAPVGFRSDCLGTLAPLPAWAEDPSSKYVQSKDPLVTELGQRFASVPVITEWCDFTNGRDPRSYYEQALRDVVRYHVSMTSSVNFLDSHSTTPMDPELYLLWAHANAFAGYRYSVEARPAESVSDGGATITVTWTNYGAAAATERWVPGYRLVDFSGAVIRTLPSNVTLKTLVHDQSADSSDRQPVPVSASESVRVDPAGLAPGHYTLRASVDWEQHKPGASHVVDYPPMQLARDGRDGSGWYPVAALDISRDGLPSPPQR